MVGLWWEQCRSRAIYDAGTQLPPPAGPMGTKRHLPLYMLMAAHSFMVRRAQLKTTVVLLMHLPPMAPLGEKRQRGMLATHVWHRDGGDGDDLEHGGRCLAVWKVGF